MGIVTLDFESLNSRFEASTPQEILEWALESFWPAIAMSSSFQTQSIPLLHRITQIKPELPVFFLDTGYHFQETLEFKANLQKTWGINIIDLRNEECDDEKDAHSGEQLYLTDPERCCYINKVAPMKKALQNMRAWITGIRREQTPERPQANIIERRSSGLVKINPILNWTQADVYRNIYGHNLPMHPLFTSNYPSVGCAPCTRPVQPGEQERGGRWAGSDKTECGLHTIFFS